MSPRKGIIEGFYGSPWTDVERIHMVEFAADHGFTHFLYAPKHDPYIREIWREVALTSDRKAHLDAWVAKAKERKLTPGFAVAPGLDVSFADDTDQRCLNKKVGYLVESGIEEIALLFDDIDPTLKDADHQRFVNYAEAQAVMANRLVEYLGEVGSPGIQITFCPTEYWGLQNTWYKAVLARVLRPEISVFWTGRQICSESIVASEARRAEELFQHPIVIWDNYPVNDAEMVHEIHLGPLEGRGPDLLSGVEGYYVNPMSRPNASKIALITVGEYLTDPEHYDPWQAHTRAIEHWGAEYSRSLAELSWVTRYSCCGQGSQYESAVRECSEPNLPPALEDLLSRWVRCAPSELPAPLYSELEPWISKLQALARWVSELPSGNVSTVRALESAVFGNPSLVLGHAIERWVERVRADQRSGEGRSELINTPSRQTDVV
jgi:hypothetical protein